MHLLLLQLLSAFLEIRKKSWLVLEKSYNQYGLKDLKIKYNLIGWSQIQYRLYCYYVTCTYPLPLHRLSAPTAHMVGQFQRVLTITTRGIYVQT